MSIFHKIRGTSVNVSKIKEIGVARKDALRIVFDDGTAEIYSVSGDAAREMELIRMIVTQLIPCPASVYNVYSNEDGSYFHERVYYLALCADGAARSLSLADGFFEIAEKYSNYVGCHEESKLCAFPTHPEKHN